LTTVFVDNNINPSTGVNTFVFQTPFVWDGTSNLVLQACYDNTSAGITDNVVYYSPGFVASQSVGGSTSGCALTGATTSSNRPVFFFGNRSGYVLPATNGAPGQVLTQQTNGTVSWQTPAAVELTNVSAPLIGNGGSTALGIQTASASQPGALSAADWTTFNSKFTLPSLTSGSVIFSNGTTVAQNNASFFWDNTNTRLGLGTTSPGQRLNVVGIGRFENAGAALQLAGTGSGSHAFMEFYPDGIADGRRAYFGFPSNGSTELSLMNTLPSGTVTLGTNATTRVTVSSAGSVGIGTPTPSSSLQVAGTIATTPVTGIAGGTAAAPTLLNGSNSSYLGLSPASGTNNNYRLPDPATCAGRMYVIRNNSGSFTAILTTAAGQLFNGSGNTGFASYTLNTNSAGKTLILFNDGVNWTIGQLN
jgi:hypothetical protein